MTMLYTAYNETWEQWILASHVASHLISTTTDLYKE